MELTPAQKRKNTMERKFGKDWARKNGLAAAATIKAKNPNHYSEIGQAGQQAYLSQPREQRKPRGFAADRKRASVVGAIGGRRSRRGKAN